MSTATVPAPVTKADTSDELREKLAGGGAFFAEAAFSLHPNIRLHHFGLELAAAVAAGEDQLVIELADNLTRQKNEITVPHVDWKQANLRGFSEILMGIHRFTEFSSGQACDVGRRFDPLSGKIGGQPIEYHCEGEDRDRVFNIANGYQAALQKRDGVVSNVRCSPHTHGYLARSVELILGKAFSEFSDDQELQKAAALKAAVGCMYLVDLTEYTPLLEKLIQGVESRPEHASLVGKLLKEFNLVDETHQDLELNAPSEVLSVLKTRQAKIFEKQAQLAQGFLSAYFGEHRNGRESEVWGESLAAPLVRFKGKDDTDVQYRRLTRVEASKFASDIRIGKIASFSFAPQEKGKLVGAVCRCTDALGIHGRSRQQEDALVEALMAGLYLLKSLDSDFGDMLLGRVTRKRSDLTLRVREEGIPFGYTKLEELLRGYSERKAGKKPGE